MLNPAKTGILYAAKARADCLQSTTSDLRSAPGCAKPAPISKSPPRAVQEVDIRTMQKVSKYFFTIPNFPKDRNKNVYLRL